MNIDHVITDHAVVRFIERNDGIDTRAAREMASATADGSDAAILLALGILEGIDASDVRHRMLTPTLRTAIGCGAIGVKRDHLRFVIIDGRVITVRLAMWDRRTSTSMGGSLHRMREFSQRAAAE